MASRITPIAVLGAGLTLGLAATSFAEAPDAGLGAIGDDEHLVGVLLLVHGCDEFVPVSQDSDPNHPMKVAEIVDLILVFQQ